MNDNADEGRYTGEAKRHLSAYMARLGQTQIAKQILEEGFAVNTDRASDNADVDYTDVIESAKEYCRARNKNLRPVRQVDPNNESAVEGQKSALEFIERRRRSIVRK